MGRIVIVGGGVAGLATAAELAARGRAVLLVEQASGPSDAPPGASWFRTAFAEPVNVRLALRSKAIGDELVEGGTVRSAGAFHVVEDAGLRESFLDASAIAGVRPARPGDVPKGLSAPTPSVLVAPVDGAVDAVALLRALRTSALRAGASIRMGVTVTRVEPSGGVVLESGEELNAELVVDATGAWNPLFSRASDVGVRMATRHVFELDLTEDVPSFRDHATPLVVSRDRGRLFASPVDDVLRARPLEVAVARALLLDRLAQQWPSLAKATIVHEAALRLPLTPDRRFMLGMDPVVPQLFRVGGFGDHGLAAGPAAGELAAQVICGEDPPLARELRPDRFGALGVNPFRNELARFC